MPDNIMRMVAIRRPLIAGLDTTDELQALIAGYADAALYRRSASQLPKMQRELARYFAREMLPMADEVGRSATGPILKALQGSEFTLKGNPLRGKVLDNFHKYRRRNLRALESILDGEVGGLDAEIKTAFAKAQRDGVSRRELIGNLVEADKAEMARLKTVRGEIRQAGDRLADAEADLAKAPSRQENRLERERDKARTEAKKVGAKVGAAKTFFARFETRIQAEARDAIRREAESAQEAYFEQAGYTEFTWVAVNGPEACPQCEARHGWTFSDKEWAKKGRPGEGKTYCKNACMCALVPAEYAASRQGLEKPLSLVA